MGNAFCIDPGDPGSIPGLFVTHWIWRQTRFIEYQLYGVNHGPAWKHALGLAIHVKQDEHELVRLRCQAHSGEESNQPL